MVVENEFKLQELVTMSQNLGLSLPSFSVGDACPLICETFHPVL